jgi:penicillin amidase
MPHIYNPVSGYIVSANNPAVSSHYPYSLTFRCGITPYRAQRITELLKAKSDLTTKDMEAIQNDTVSLLWKDLRNDLLKTKALDNRGQKALTMLQDWDGNMSLDSIPATVFTYWYKEISKLIPENIKEFSNWPEPEFIKQQLSKNGKYCRTSSSKDCAEFLSSSLQSAMAKLTQEHGNLEHNWLWGKLHTAAFKELGLGEVKLLGWIWNRSISTAGDPYTVNVGTYEQYGYNQVDGVGYRQIIDLYNIENSEYIHAMGQSNDFLSKNYADQMILWRDGKYISMSENKHTPNKTLILEPKL